MKTIGVLAGLALFLGVSAAHAGEQVEVKPPKVPKAEKLELVKEQIAKAEKTIQQWTDSAIAQLEKKSPQQAKYAKAGRKNAQDALPRLRLELAWLEGRFTRDMAEKAVKSAEEAAAKAKDSEKASTEAALVTARAELELVKNWESTTAP